MGNKLIAAVLVSLLAGSLQTSHPNRTITVTVVFDYDFTITPACSAKVTQVCVQQFNLYEVSLGISRRAKLLSIPVPAGATGFVKGISATTEPYLFDSGRHRLAVSAQTSNGLESDLSKCTTIINVP
jgi:hypothetical protein